MCVLALSKHGTLWDWTLTFLLSQTQGSPLLFPSKLTMVGIQKVMPTNANLTPLSVYPVYRLMVVASKDRDEHCLAKGTMLFTVSLSQAPHSNSYIPKIICCIKMIIILWELILAYFFQWIFLWIKCQGMYIVHRRLMYSEQITKLYGNFPQTIYRI